MGPVRCYVVILICVTINDSMMMMILVLNPFKYVANIVEFKSDKFQKAENYCFGRVQSSKIQYEALEG